MSMVCDHMLPYTPIYSNNSHITLPLGHLITDIYVYIYSTNVSSSNTSAACRPPVTLQN